MLCPHLGIPISAYEIFQTPIHLLNILLTDSVLRDLEHLRVHYTYIMSNACLFSSILKLVPWNIRKVLN